MTSTVRRYGSNRRWLLKALREVAHEVGQLVQGLDAETLTQRPSASGLDEDWTILELVGFMRDSEREDLRSVQAICMRDGATLQERRAHLKPGEGAYRDERLPDLLWEFAGMREELLWTLQTAGPAWEHVGRHPYRGEVSLSDLVHEINERDLEVMWSLRRLRESVATPAR